jgi:carnitine O-acetyltransferase
MSAPIFRTKGKCNRLPSVDVPPPERLKFNISTEVFSAIDAAEKNIDTLVDDLQMYCFTFNTYGKGFIKTQKLSPDSFIQMAIQYAFFR